MCSWLMLSLCNILLADPTEYTVFHDILPHSDLASSSLSEVENVTPIFSACYQFRFPESNLATQCLSPSAGDVVNYSPSMFNLLPADFIQPSHPTTLSYPPLPHVHNDFLNRMCEQRPGHDVLDCIGVASLTDAFANSAGMGIETKGEAGSPLPSLLPNVASYHAS